MRRKSDWMCEHVHTEHHVDFISPVFSQDSSERLFTSLLESQRAMPFVFRHGVASWHPTSQSDQYETLLEPTSEPPNSIYGKLPHQQNINDLSSGSNAFHLENSAFVMGVTPLLSRRPRYNLTAHIEHGIIEFGRSQPVSLVSLTLQFEEKPSGALAKRSLV